MTAKVYQAGLIDAAGDVASAARLELIAGVNPVINGGFPVWQRGTSFAAAVHNTYKADRWLYVNTSAAVHTVSRQLDVPAVAALVPQDNYSLLLDVTTADASIAAGDLCLMSQPIEGFNWAPFAQKQVTVGFWVKDTITGVHCVSLHNSGLNRSCVMEYTINVADTWEYKTLTFPASPSAGTWNYTTSVGVYLSFVLACGSTYQTTAGAWQTGNFRGTANQVNSLSSTSNNFYLWGVTMGLGATVAPYWPRQYGLELALCQRHYEMMTTLSGNAGIGSGQVSGGTTGDIIMFYAPKRVSPTFTFNNPTHYSVFASGTSYVVNSFTIIGYSNSVAYVRGNVTGPMTVGVGCNIATTNVDATTEIDAEL